MLNQHRVKKIGLVAAGLFVLPLYTAPAHAYIDPGTASIVLQSIIGAIAAGSLFFRTHLLAAWYKVFPSRTASEPATSARDGAGDAG